MLINGDCPVEKLWRRFVSSAVKLYFDCSSLSDTLIANFPGATILVRNAEPALAIFVASSTASASVTEIDSLESFWALARDEETLGDALFVVISVAPATPAVDIERARAHVLAMVSEDSFFTFSP